MNYNEYINPMDEEEEKLTQKKELERIEKEKKKSFDEKEKLKKELHHKQNAVDDLASDLKSSEKMNRILKKLAHILFVVIVILLLYYFFKYLGNRIKPTYSSLPESTTPTHQYTGNNYPINYLRKSGT